VNPILEFERGAEPIDRAVVDLVVAGFFADDRPIRGAAGRVDWRLCGLISQQLESERLRGESGDAILLATFGRLEAPRVLALGLGERVQFDRDDVRGHVRDAVTRTAQLGVSSIALAPLDLAAGPRASSLDVAERRSEPSGSRGWNELSESSELIELIDDIVSAALDALRGAGASLRARLLVEPDQASRVSRALGDATAGSPEMIFEGASQPARGSYIPTGTSP